MKPVRSCWACCCCCLFVSTAVLRQRRRKWRRARRLWTHVSIKLRERRKTEKKKRKVSIPAILYRKKEWSEKYIRRSRQLRSQFSLLLLLPPSRPSVSLYILLLSRRVSPADTHTLRNRDCLLPREIQIYIGQLAIHPSRIVSVKLVVWASRMPSCATIRRV